MAHPKKARAARMLGRLIRDWRMTRGFSQPQLAALIGVHPTQLCRAESADPGVSREYQERIARDLGIDGAAIEKAAGDG